MEYKAPTITTPPWDPALLFVEPQTSHEYYSQLVNDIGDEVGKDLLIIYVPLDGFNGIMRRSQADKAGLHHWVIRAVGEGDSSHYELLCKKPDLPFGRPQRPELMTLASSPTKGGIVDLMFRHATEVQKALLILAERIHGVRQDGLVIGICKS